MHWWEQGAQMREVLTWEFFEKSGGRERNSHRVILSSRSIQPTKNCGSFLN